MAIGQLTLLFTVILLLGMSPANPVKAQHASININIEIPSWAPYYEYRDQVRYYYIPDIECYYDLRTREFVYMQDGVWFFSRFLPPAYAWFNLNNCFVVALDHRVHQPWRHFHYYVSHYPRFYYRSFYKNRHWEPGRPLRGYNENERREVYNHREDMEYYSRYRGEEHRNADYRRYEGKPSQRDNYGPNRSAGPGGKSEPVQYYGKRVGKPVKVQKNMKEAPSSHESSRSGSGHRQK